MRHKAIALTFFGILALQLAYCSQQATDIPALQGPYLGQTSNIYWVDASVIEDLKPAELK